MSLRRIVVLLTWLYLSALMVLLGAVINAQWEKQVGHGFIEGPLPTTGGRNARVANTFGESTG